MSSDLNQLPAKIQDISKQIEELALNKDRAAKALAQVEQLDSMTGQIEERIDQMQKAREWLARTETRLEQIAKQSDDQLKLLGNLLKQSGKQGGGDKDNAPSNRVRNMVRQLAHQGWGVNEIAKQTQLSRGEVELILELLPK
jgi:seryl-tRNA synthetase